MNKASSLERLFTRLTSEGTHASVARQFIQVFDEEEGAVHD
jgi:hypothetical protein